MKIKAIIGIVIACTVLTVSISSCSSPNTIADYSRALDNNKRDEDAWTRLAEAYYAEGDINSAISTYENALEYIDSRKIVERISELKSERVQSSTTVSDISHAEEVDTAIVETEITEYEGNYEEKDKADDNINDKIEEPRPVVEFITGNLYYDEDWYLCWDLIPEADFYYLSFYELDPDDYSEVSGTSIRKIKPEEYETHKKLRANANICSSRIPYKVEVYAIIPDPYEEVLIGSLIYTPSKMISEAIDTFNVNDTIQLSFEDGSKAEWLSYNPYVASVDQSGKITILHNGDGCIYALCNGVIYEYDIDTCKGNTDNNDRNYHGVRLGENYEYSDYEANGINGIETYNFYYYDFVLGRDPDSFDWHSLYEGEYSFNSLKSIFVPGDIFNDYIIKSCSTSFAFQTDTKVGEYLSTTGVFTVECDIEYFQEYGYIDEYYARFKPSELGLPTNTADFVSVSIAVPDNLKNKISQIVNEANPKAHIKMTAKDYFFNQIDFYDYHGAELIDIIEQDDTDYYSTDYLSWDKDGTFDISLSLFGKTYTELCDMLGVTLEEPRCWEYFGRNFTYAETDAFQYPNVVFIFDENGYCCRVHNDQRENNNPSLRKHLQEKYNCYYQTFYVEYDNYYFELGEWYDDNDGNVFQMSFLREDYMDLLYPNERAGYN